MDSTLTTTEDQKFLNPPIKEEDKNIKRKLDPPPLAYKRSESKLARDRGLPHISKRKKENRGRKPPGGKVCGQRCQKPGCLIPEAEKVKLFNQLWEVGSWDKQRTFLISLVDRIQPKERTTADPSTSKRLNTFIYFIRYQGQRHSCCRKTLMSTFGITEEELRHVCSLLVDGVIIATDRRGEHRKNLNTNNNNNIINNQ